MARFRPAFPWLALDENVILRAGAGTGKTHALITMAMGLLGGLRRGQAIDPHQLWLLTFGEQAAGELRVRLRQRIAALAAAGSPETSRARARLAARPRRSKRAAADAPGRLARAPGGDRRRQCHHAARGGRSPAARARGSWARRLSGAGCGDSRQAAGVRGRGRNPQQWVGQSECTPESVAGGPRLPGLPLPAWGRGIVAGDPQEALRGWERDSTGHGFRRRGRSRRAVAGAVDRAGSRGVFREGRHWARYSAGGPGRGAPRRSGRPFGPGFSRVRHGARCSKGCSPRRAAPSTAPRRPASRSTSFASFWGSSDGHSSHTAGLRCVARAKAEDLYRAAKARRRGGLDFSDLCNLSRDLLRDDPVAPRGRPRPRSAPCCSTKLRTRAGFGSSCAFCCARLAAARRRSIAVTEPLSPPDAQLEQGVLCAVGDRKQSIYEFQGANVVVFEELAAAGP